MIVRTEKRRSGLMLRALAGDGQLRSTAPADMPRRAASGKKKPALLSADAGEFPWLSIPRQVMRMIDAMVREAAGDCPLTPRRVP
jgi:hypothetical protein